ncbi:amidohydrolase family protein [Candidatus Latescibacterota bacterium]
MKGNAMKSPMIMVILLVICSFAASGYAQESAIYDILLKGGHVIDPANNIDKVCDVAVADGVIARIEVNISPASARKVVDVSGYIVSPGFLDIHSHCFATFGNPGRWVFPDHHSFQSGVTTFIDAGTSGAESFEDFKKVIDISKTRILVFLNISAPGKNNSQNEPINFKVDLAVETARKYPEIIVGFKTCDYWPAGNPYDEVHTPWASVDSALAAGKKSGLPVMSSFHPRPAEGDFPVRSLRELLLEKFRRGDILTCMFSPHIPIISEDGNVNRDLIKARKRGILFDGTHGAGSLLFRSAAPLIKQGFIPNTISTDLHGPGRTSAVVDMLTVMTKYLNLGIPVGEVIRCSTINPALAVNRPDLGTLSVGAVADIAVIEKLTGKYTFVDSGGGKISGDTKLQIIMTLFGGGIVFDPYGVSYPNWEDIPESARYWKTPSGQTW